MHKKSIWSNTEHLSHQQYAKQADSQRYKIDLRNQMHRVSACVAIGLLLPKELS